MRLNQEPGPADNAVLIFLSGHHHYFQAPNPAPPKWLVSRPLSMLAHPQPTLPNNVTMSVLTFHRSPNRLVRRCHFHTTDMYYILYEEQNQ